MKKSKAYYRGLAKWAWMRGYRWGGWLEDEGLHFFVKEYPEKQTRTGPDTWRIEPRKWSEIKCRESEIADGSLAILIRLGQTR